MKKHTKIILAVVMAVTALMICACGGNGSTSGTAPQGNAVPHEKVTPTFKYFYTNAEKDTVMPIVDELKEKYGDSVVFDIVNVDENKEILQNFQLVDGNTPALIMLNTDNDISKLEFQCTDIEVLKADIDETLN